MLRSHVCKMPLHVHARMHTEIWENARMHIEIWENAHLSAKGNHLSGLKLQQSTQEERDLCFLLDVFYC